MEENRVGNKEKCMSRKDIIIILLIFLSVKGFSQYHKFEDQIQWFNTESGVLPDFDRSINEAEYNGVPYYYTNLKLYDEGDSFLPVLSVKKESKIVSSGIIKILQKKDISTKYSLQSGTVVNAKKNIGYCKILPFRYDKETGDYFRLESFYIEYIVEKSLNANKINKRKYNDNSVLSTGKWYKIAVDTCGVFKLTYNDFVAMGFDVNSLSSSKIHVYGNGGGMLPELLSEFRYDGLQEIAIRVNDNGDGVFDSGDEVLFYAESPHIWYYNQSTQKFHHKNNYYSDKNHYFVTIGSGNGKRIISDNGTSDSPNYEVEDYDELFYHEKDAENLINVGREWYGEKFDLETHYQFNVDITGIVPNQENYFFSRLVARSTTSSLFSVELNNDSYSVAVPAISDVANSAYAITQSRSTTFSTNANTLTVDMNYHKSNNSSAGWLDYFEINYRRQLKLYGSQSAFRDKNSCGEGNISRFHFHGNDAEIWEITDPCNIKRINTTAVSGEQYFVLHTDTLRSFVAFNGDEYFTPELVGEVANQNIHALPLTEYFIIARKDFLDEANRLADFHRNKSNLKIKVVTLEEIYNEFSGGSQDITAIRDFMKVYYDRGNADTHLKYLLLFGDGSFDYKDKIENNSNIVPTYETIHSLHPVNSYVTDDYYGFLDDYEGGMENNVLDIGIGRLPVSTIEQAQQVVDKIISYGSNNKQVQKDWRNTICFIADDEDFNAHIDYANRMATFVDTSYNNFNIDKIYLDAYKQESTPGGQRYPEVQSAINDRVQQGALIVNYTGHGGEVGLTHERVMEIADIESWHNSNALPLFITATCEFSRFDDPERVSAGELVLLNPHGGGIGLLTTTRPTYGTPNFSLNMSFYKHAFEKVDGQLPTFGDLLRIMKTENGSLENGRKFVLLGDPALRLEVPDENVAITTINNRVPSNDTIKALMEVEMCGEVRDSNGDIMNDFNGVVYPTIYDKESLIVTLANDPESSPFAFKLRKNILYSGMADVNNGSFTFTFKVPKDIDYQYGQGRVSLYASGNNTDASGYYEDIVVGGFDADATVDNQGPVIKMYFNDSLFIDGGVTNCNPVLYAHISDENGVNTVGSGIGHDITAFIDNTDDVKILNQFYTADLNTYKKGVVEYPFSNLTQGDHTITLKAWDVYNNSTLATLDFIVVEEGQMVVQRLMNYPNPFKEQTSFVIEHNQSAQQLDVEINIYDISGRGVARLTQSIFSDGFKTSPILWNGTANNGDYLAKGLYIYTLTLKNEQGLVAKESNKLIIIR